MSLGHPKNHGARHRPGGADVIPGISSLATIRYFVTDYGALGDGVTDNVAAITAAIAAAIAGGGGEVFFPPGTYLVSDTVLLAHSGIAIRGAGQDVSIIKRTGASTNPVVWLRTPDGQGTVVRDARLSDLTIDGNAAAQYGVQLTTLEWATVTRLKITGATAYQLYMNCWDVRPGGGDPRDNQQCAISDLYLKCAGSQGGAYLTGNTVVDANTSLNYFRNIFPWIVDGDGFTFANSDGNLLSHLRVYRAPAGTGRGLVYAGSNVSNVAMARNNQAINVQATGAGIYALAGTYPSYGNIVVASIDNGGADPVVSAGAGLSYWNENRMALSAITFPATQVPSADANTLDDFEEGTFVPAIGFSTANGDLNVVYSIQVGYYQKIGRVVHWQIHVLTSTFTWTTASGNFLVNGLPYAAQNTAGDLGGGCVFGGYTKANFTTVLACVTHGQSRFAFLVGGSGQTPAALTQAETPSGGTIHIRASGSYVAAA